MSEVGDNNFMRYIYRGEEGEIIPRGATHNITVREDVTVIRARAFYEHPNIVEVICHENVEKIEENAFYNCPRLRRVIIPGVKIVKQGTFYGCEALMELVCGKLEIIQEHAFCDCRSLRSINLPSARIVEEGAFGGCDALMDAKFGSKLERIEDFAFCNCKSLKRITIPLKDGLITHDSTIEMCSALNHVDLVEGSLLKTIAALHLEDWRNDMNEEIYSINQILPTACAGYYDEEEEDVEGEKVVAIRTWISSLLGKIIYYKAEHRRLLDEDIAPTLQRFVPQDIVMNNVLSFIELPSHSFE